MTTEKTNKDLELLRPSLCRQFKLRLYGDEPEPAQRVLASNTVIAAHEEAVRLLGGDPEVVFSELDLLLVNLEVAVAREAVRLAMQELTLVLRGTAGGPKSESQRALS